MFNNQSYWYVHICKQQSGSEWWNSHILPHCYLDGIEMSYSTTQINICLQILIDILQSKSYHINRNCTVLRW